MGAPSKEANNHWEETHFGSLNEDYVYRQDPFLLTRIIPEVLE